MSTTDPDRDEVYAILETAFPELTDNPKASAMEAFARHHQQTLQDISHTLTQLITATQAIDRALRPILEGRTLLPGELTPAELANATPLLLAERLAEWLHYSAQRVRYGWSPESMAHRINDRRGLVQMINRAAGRYPTDLEPVFPSDILPIVIELQDDTNGPQLHRHTIHAYARITTEQATG